MIKMVYLVNRRSDISAEEFSAYWRNEHAAIAKKLPGMRKYIQNHAQRSPDGSAPAYDGYVEIWFDDADALNAALAADEGKATLADAENFMDVDNMLAFSVEEVTVI